MLIPTVAGFLTMTTIGNSSFAPSDGRALVKFIAKELQPEGKRNIHTQRVIQSRAGETMVLPEKVKLASSTLLDWESSLRHYLNICSGRSNETNQSPIVKPISVSEAHRIRKEALREAIFKKNKTQWAADVRSYLKASTNKMGFVRNLTQDLPRGKEFLEAIEKITDTKLKNDFLNDIDQLFNGSGFGSAVLGARPGALLNSLENPLTRKFVLLIGAKFGMQVIFPKDKNVHSELKKDAFVFHFEYLKHSLAENFDDEFKGTKGWLANLYSGDFRRQHIIRGVLSGIHPEDIRNHISGPKGQQQAILDECMHQYQGSYDLRFTWTYSGKEPEDLLDRFQKKVCGFIKQI